MKFASLTLALLGLGCFAAWFFGRPGAEAVPPAEALAASPHYHVVDFARRDDGRFTVTLTNNSPAPVSVKEVDVGCSACTALLSHPAGRTLAPGETFEVVGVARPPQAGPETRRLRFHHSGAGSPLVVTVDVVGDRKPPYVLTTSGSRISFFNLKSTDDAASYSVVTVEPAGSPRWVKELQCGLEECHFTSLNVFEQPLGTTVRRAYEFRVGWHRLPPGLEFHADVFAVTSSGREQLAALQGTRPRVEQ